MGLNRLAFLLFIGDLVLIGITFPLRAVPFPADVYQPGEENLQTAPVSNVDARIDPDQTADTHTTYLPMLRRRGPDVCGAITTDTTWTTVKSPYQVTCDVLVTSGVTLTIEAGATVQFSHVEDDLIINGALQAVGTEYNPIHFLPVSGVSAGDWGHIAFMPGSQGILDHAILEYGGNDWGMLFIASDGVQVLNSVVQYSANTGIVIQEASPLISGTQILSNTASVSGGGLYNDSGDPVIQNNIFKDNLIDNDWGVFCYGGGLFNADGNPTIQNNLILNNSCSGYDGYGGGVYNESGSPIIQNNILSGNSANYQCAHLFCSNSFGGGLYNGSGSPIIQNNTFIGNSAADGGGFYNESGNPIIQNDTFSENHANLGGGLYYLSGNSIIYNNTFSDNSGGWYGQGGGLFIADGSPNIRSNIVVSNWYGGIVGSGAGTQMMDYNDVWNNFDEDYGGSVTAGAHDISADPLLADPTKEDFHLSPGSPCIDAGDPVNYPLTDYEGDLRPQGLAPDIGADEYRDPP